MMSDDGFSPIPPSIREFAQEPNPNPNPNPNSNPAKRKRNLPGTPDPDAEVIALSPKSLMATNRFLCEICNKGFQRDQNLQLHRRGHNLPWKLKQRTSKEIKKKVYICPEKTCVHHDPSRALGDLTGIKKHFSRKHGEKKWKCEKCSKKYAVQSDWKAHSKICGTREYKCDCGTIFSRKDSFITHRAFCDALAEESARFTSVPTPNLNFRNELVNGSISNLQAAGNPQFPVAFRPDLVGLEGGQLSMDGLKPRVPMWLDQGNNNSHLNPIGNMANSLPENIFGLSTQENVFGNFSSPPALPRVLKEEEENKGNLSETMSSFYFNNPNNLQEQEALPHMSATALLQKAAQMGSTRTSALFNNSFGLMSSSTPSSSLSMIPSFNSFNQGRSEVHHKLNEVMINNVSDLAPSSTSNGGGLLWGGDMKSSRNLDRPICGDQSLTRDFLGVGGGDHGGRPLSQQELAKFASLGSAMGLSHQYSGSHS
ncbi:zinc finger protein BALDIBIS-like isoform X2 [Actinidia eriantha]|uniref:zinc finger protein BALDIBIS-like isoform X2 n=1 Tax=Actinidia eriantha TaxID=165200 RepID=UPI002584B37B|nr:zinc finger protein BALDIBIS-like isoform X2 [Actinidia eriantha]